MTESRVTDGGRMLRRLSTDEAVRAGVRPPSATWAVAWSRWNDEWHRRLGCWFTQLPMRTRAALEGCLGALALHVGGRFDAAWNGASGGAHQAAGAEHSGCEWLREASQKETDGLTQERDGVTLEREALTLPAFPRLPDPITDPIGSFAIPPIPRLVPSWRELRTFAAHERVAAETKRATRARGGGMTHHLIGSRRGEIGSRVGEITYHRDSNPLPPALREYSINHLTSGSRIGEITSRRSHMEAANEPRGPILRASEFGELRAKLIRAEGGRGGGAEGGRTGDTWGAPHLADTASGHRSADDSWSEARLAAGAALGATLALLLLAAQRTLRQRCAPSRPRRFRHWGIDMTP